MDPAEGMQWQLGQAYQLPEMTASQAKYLNRSTVLEELLLANSERPSIRAPRDIPINSAVELFSAAYRDQGPVVTPITWTNRLAALGDPWPLALLVNSVLPSIAAQTVLPINEVVELADRG